MLYISSSCLRYNKIETILVELAENELYNIELSGGTEYYEGLIEDLIRIKRKYGLKYACHAYFPPPKIPYVLNLASCNDAIYYQSIQHYERCIDLLPKLGCYSLSIHAGFLIEVNANEIGHKLNCKVAYDEQEAYSRFCKAYKYIDNLCKNGGIKLYLENNVLSQQNYQEFNYHNYMMMTDYRSIMRMKQQLEFNLLLDLGHLYVSASTLNYDFKEECNKLRDMVTWIHLSDNAGTMDEHKPLSKDSQIVLEFLKIQNPNIHVTLETCGDITDILNSIAIVRSK